MNSRLAMWHLEAGFDAKRQVAQLLPPEPSRSRGSPKRNITMIQHDTTCYCKKGHRLRWLKDLLHPLRCDSRLLRLHCVAKELGGLDHQGVRHRPRHGRSMETIVLEEDKWFLQLRFGHVVSCGFCDCGAPKDTWRSSMNYHSCRRDDWVAMHHHRMLMRTGTLYITQNTFQHVISPKATHLVLQALGNVFLDDAGLLADLGEVHDELMGALVVPQSWALVVAIKNHDINPALALQEFSSSTTCLKF